MSEYVHSYFKEKSESTGISMSTLMYLALEQYVDSKMAMDNIPSMVKELEKINVTK